MSHRCAELQKIHSRKKFSTFNDFELYSMCCGVMLLLLIMYT